MILFIHSSELLISEKNEIVLGHAAALHIAIMKIALVFVVPLVCTTTADTQKLHGFSSITFLSCY